MNFIAAAVTDKGTENEKNQDSVVVRSAMTGGGYMCMAVICDGLGGLCRGEVASSHVALGLADWFLEKAPSIKNITMAVNGVRTRLLTLHEELAQYAKCGGYAVGTTASILMLGANRYGFVHVGDTRIYKIAGKCRCLTTDHCISEQVLTQCVGGTEKILPQLGYGSVSGGTIFLLCSDGFRHKNNEKIFSTYYIRKNNRTEAQLKEHTDMLVERCRYMGEKDNVTAVVIRTAAL
jgi:serine/threonine protein phosphatase PrpC